MPKKHLPELEKNGNSEILFVIAHGYNGSSKNMEDIRRVLAKDYPDADFLIPDLAYSTILSTTSPVNVSKDLLERIDHFWAERKTRGDGQPYKKIILIGSSLGGLIIRKVYIYACGENHKAPFEKEITVKTPREWATQVDRIILLAAINRGWGLTHNLGLKRYLSFSLGIAISWLASLIGIKFTMMEARRGMPFVAELRAQWLLMRNRRDTKLGKATTIQLLGSIDDLVSPEDNVDLISGADFIYLDVPDSGHTSILEMDDSEKKIYQEAGVERARIFRNAVRLTPAELEKHQSLPADFNSLVKARTDITDVVFVIHGIRDEGYWTHKIARRIQALAKQEGKNRKFASETSSYGYFPIIDFLYPGRRMKKVHWLMDEYIEAMALFPNADFHYVGHSNGTYLLAKALETYECCRFKHVVFGSSVVRTDYDWDTQVKKGKVKAMLNFRATSDIVVAWAPYAFENLGFPELGGAGHAGFKSESVHQIQFVRGGHGASVHEKNWDSIARFILNGPPAVKAEGFVDSDHPSRFRFWTMFGARGIFLILAFLIVLAIGYLIWYFTHESKVIFALLISALYLTLVFNLLKKI